MTAVIFDTETTGLLLPSLADLARQPYILEVGAVIVKCGSIVAELSQVLSVPVLVTAEMTKYNGITQLDTVGKPSFKDFLPQLAKFFKGSQILFAHNAPFDTGMLRNELKRSGQPKFPWPKEIVCTVAEYTPIFGYRPSLKVLHQKILGVPLEQKHRALDDVKALYSILRKDGVL